MSVLIFEEDLQSLLSMSLNKKPNLNYLRQLYRSLIPYPGLPDQAFKLPTSSKTPTRPIDYENLKETAFDQATHDFITFELSNPGIQDAYSIEDLLDRLSAFFEELEFELNLQ